MDNVTLPPPARATGPFLSHFKQETGTEARLVADRLKQLLPDLTTFIDSDDLYDLRSLLEDVKHSGVLVLLQSSGVLTRPWCLLVRVARRI